MYLFMFTCGYQGLFNAKIILLFYGAFFLEFVLDKARKGFKFICSLVIFYVNYKLNFQHCMDFDRILGRDLDLEPGACQ